MSTTNKKNELRARRKQRIRKKIAGTTERPRLTVSRSARHIYAQVIDDTAGNTLVSIHSFGKGNSDKRAGVDECRELGKKLAEKCKAKNVNTVVFDKNGYSYHGRVKALADGAREGGLEF